MLQRKGAFSPNITTSHVINMAEAKSYHKRQLFQGEPYLQSSDRASNIYTVINKIDSGSSSKVDENSCAINIDCIESSTVVRVALSNHFQDIKEAQSQRCKNKFKDSLRLANRAFGTKAKLTKGLVVGAGVSTLMLSPTILKAFGDGLKDLELPGMHILGYVFAVGFVPLCVLYIVNQTYEFYHNSLLVKLQDEFTPKLDALAAVLKNECRSEKAEILKLSAKLSDAKNGAEVHRDKFTKYYAELEKGVAGLLMIKTEEVQNRIKDILDPPDVLLDIDTNGQQASRS